jgi:hypothetical protein
MLNKEGKTVTFFDHRMAGGHDPKMVSQGVAMDMQTSREGGTIKTTIKLHNRLPHAFPTGAPFRNLYLKVATYDKDGKVLWQSYQTHPSKDDPKAFFIYAMGKDGHPALPPEATEILGDSRLKPNEERTLEYAVPVDDKTAILRAELFYNLLSPVLIEKFGERMPPEAKTPTLAASAELRF